MVDDLVLPEVVVDGRLPLQGPYEVGVGPVEVLGLHGEEGGMVSSTPLHYVIVAPPPPGRGGVRKEGYIWQLAI